VPEVRNRVEVNVAHEDVSKIGISTTAAKVEMTNLDDRGVCLA